jgi:PAS domain S-box-containing protein
VEREITNDDEFLRLIFASATDFAIFSMDRQGIVSSWNPGAERLLGYAQGEIIGRSADIIFPPEEGGEKAGLEERRKALADGRAEDERWQMRKDGERFWASGLLMPLADPALGFIKILRDRTPQHSAETELKESEERFRLLATNIPQLVFRSRADGWRTWPSPQWIRFTGLNAQASEGLGWVDAIHPEDRLLTMSAWDEATARGEYLIEHRVLNAAAGSYRWHQTRARPIDEARMDWVGTMTDIHDMREIQKRQDVLLAELQHRTRNLLAVVQAIATQTIKASDGLATFHQNFLSRLRALSRVQSLLAHSQRHDVNLRDLVTGELEAHTRGSTAVTIGGPPVTLPVDLAQPLALALHELATNALKYGALASPDGRLDVIWRVASSGSSQSKVVLDWIESGVDLAGSAPRSRNGYGLELIERALPYQLGTKTAVRFAEDGVRCTIEIGLPEADGAQP